jgi:hypothetical protein
MNFISTVGNDVSDALLLKDDFDENGDVITKNVFFKRFEPLLQILFLLAPSAAMLAYTLDDMWKLLCPFAATSHDIPTYLYHQAETALFIFSFTAFILIGVKVKKVMRLLDVGWGGTVKKELLPWKVYVGLALTLGLFR